ncbi:MAG: DoxX family protein [Oligoflexus sp.]
MSIRTFLYSFNHSLAMLVLRVGLGATMFLAHGLGKLTSFPNPDFPDPFRIGATTSMGLAVFAEVFCALLLILGLWTRLAAIPLITTMAVAFFIIHADDPLRNKELALLYLFGFVTLFFGGPGQYSVDAKMKRS